MSHVTHSLDVDDVIDVISSKWQCETFVINDSFVILPPCTLCYIMTVLCRQKTSLTRFRVKVYKSNTTFAWEVTILRHASLDMSSIATAHVLSCRFVSIQLEFELQSLLCCMPLPHHVALSTHHCYPRAELFRGLVDLITGIPTIPPWTRVPDHSLRDVPLLLSANDDISLFADMTT